LKYYRNLSAKLIIALSLSGAGAGAGANAAEAGKAPQTCDRAVLADLDYFTCEGTRLRAKGQALEAEARAQITRSSMMSTECPRQQDEGAARDCNLISSDLLEDSLFKRAEAADILNEADRMEARAADLRKARP
jgi:hypothetical protein